MKARLPIEVASEIMSGAPVFESASGGGVEPTTFGFGRPHSAEQVACGLGFAAIEFLTNHKESAKIPLSVYQVSLTPFLATKLQNIAWLAVQNAT